MKRSGELILIPTIISENAEEQTITSFLKDRIKSIRFFLVEDIRTARRYLSRLKIYSSIEDLHFEVLNKDTNPTELEGLFKPLFSGESMGVISESGCPGVADPGALAVQFAHAHGVKVVPLVGPSSILLALMASGLNGQSFAFHGYLPIDAGDSALAIKKLEKDSKSKKQTQMFIETPYRNNQILKNLLKSLQPTTRLCVGVDLTGSEESISTKSVAEWRKAKPDLKKLPAVFLFQAT
jgi:16S rRNA (cytidine1402-2'-O)-methyltransferase